MKHTQEYADLGAHAALVITPHYYGNKMSADALINHFTAVADNSPIPILIYNVPKFTHINVTINMIAELSEHPNIIGIKESSGNIALIGGILNNVEGNFNVLVGTAGALFGSLSLGCVGGILALANIAPDNCIEIFDQTCKGNFEAAKAMQLKMIPVNNAITATYGISGLKAALDMRGYYGGEPRLPLLPLNNDEHVNIKQTLKDADLL